MSEAVTDGLESGDGPGSGPPGGGNGAGLLTPGFLARLEMLRVLVKQRIVGRMMGERASRKRGASVEFADHRDYAAGDDLRHLDWNLLARLDRPLVKTYYEEEDVDILLFVDTSRSMGFGAPPKLAYSVRLVAALGFLGLANLDRVTIVPVSTSGTPAYGPVRGRAGVFDLFGFLSRLEARDETGLDAALSRAAAAAPRPGSAIVVSDLLDPKGFETGFSRLLSRGFSVSLLHVLDRSERDPDLDGDLELVDAETGASQDVSLSPWYLERYRELFRAFVDGVIAFCNRSGVAYVSIDTGAPLEETVLQLMRRARIVG